MYTFDKLKEIQAKKFKEIHTETNYIQTAKKKERTSKAAREKKLIKYLRASIILIIDCSSETMKARRQWCYIFKVLKEKKLPTKKNRERKLLKSEMEVGPLLLAFRNKKEHNRIT